MSFPDPRDWEQTREASYQAEMALTNAALSLRLSKDEPVVREILAYFLGPKAFTDNDFVRKGQGGLSTMR